MSMKQEVAISPVGTVEYMAPEVSNALFLQHISRAYWPFKYSLGNVIAHMQPCQTELALRSLRLACSAEEIRQSSLDFLQLMLNTESIEVIMSCRKAMPMFCVLSMTASSSSGTWQSAVLQQV